MTLAEARAQILSAIDFASGALNKEPIARKLAIPGADLEFSELDLDSLAAMEVCLEIEDKTGIEIDLADLARYPTLNTLAEFMAGKTATSG